MEIMRELASRLDCYKFYLRRLVVTDEHRGVNTVAKFNESRNAIIAAMMSRNRLLITH